MPEVDDHPIDAGGGGSAADTGQKVTSESDKVIISDVVLAFMHSWYQGNNSQEIVRLALSSFNPSQLANATKIIMENFPEHGKFIAHRDTAGRSASEMFANDIMRMFQALDSKGMNVTFCCDSIAMRTVKVSTMLFSEEEPIIAHKMALMEKSITELLKGQKALFDIIGKSHDNSKEASNGRVPVQNQNGAASVHQINQQEKSFASIVNQTLNANRGVYSSKSVIKRNEIGQSRAKRINSVVEDTAFEETDDDAWEISAEEKRRQKIKKRQEERKNMDLEKKKEEEKRKSKFVVGTGSKLVDKQSDCPGQAAPKHIFVARTALTTTSEIVQDCLEYLSGIKGIATCCTPKERIDAGEAYSLSWRVQVDSNDYEKALLPSSWKTGWAVKPYFFKRKKPDSLLVPRTPLLNLLAQVGQKGHFNQHLDNE